MCTFKNEIKLENAISLVHNPDNDIFRLPPESEAPWQLAGGMRNITVRINKESRKLKKCVIGPDHWHKWFPIATAGSRQSPVDIKVSSCSTNEKLKEVIAKYTPMAGLRLENTGASWMLKMDGMTSSLTGGPLDNEYGVAQMHAHWGSKDGVGSEHTIDGRSYDAELHIVHYNTKYGDISAAVDKPDGLAVLGMFLKLGKEHKELGKICESLEDIQMKKDATALQDSIDPANFLPKNKTYYTYPGSLTTPPLLESVTWIVFKEPIEVSKKQVGHRDSLVNLLYLTHLLLLTLCFVRNTKI